VPEHGNKFQMGSFLKKFKRAKIQKKSSRVHVYYKFACTQLGIYSRIVHSYSMDIWHGCLSLTRQYLRGWNANKVSEAKIRKADILRKLEVLDDMNDDQVVQEENWRDRYQLESQLAQTYRWRKSSDNKGAV
jgi:hypothetical protein